MLFTGIALLIISLLVWVWGPRSIRTLVLIARVAPYEQQIAGAPSILILGDSTGYGTGVYRARDSIAGRIGSDFPQYSIVNDSKNGRTIESLVPVARHVQGTYALILLQIGGNDLLAGRALEEVEQELRTIIAVLSARTPHIVMISTGNVGGAPAFTGDTAQLYEARSRAFRDMYKRVAAETPLTYVDLFIEPDEDPFIKNPEQYLAFDGLHPSAAGYGRWYAQLAPTLEALLTDSGPRSY